VKPRQRLLICALLPAILGVTTYWLLRPTHSDDISKANFSRIHNGMQESQVEAVFGVPAGTYTDEVPVLFKNPSKGGTNVKSWKTWRGDHGAAFVGFDYRGEVIEKYFVQPLRASESFLGKLRRWLRL
jgi:hypothetical protein